MTTTTEQLAEALRAIAESDPKRSVPDNQFDAGWLAAHEKFCSYARAALARYDAERAPVRVRAEGQELVGHDWDNGPQAWDVVRADNDEWLCLADPQHSARIVAALNR